LFFIGEKVVEIKEGSNNIYPIAELSASADEESTTEQPRKPSILFYLFYVFIWLSLIGNLAGIIIPSIIGQEPIPNAIKGVALGVAIVTGMTARIMGKSGWTWFFIGIPLGLVTVFLLSFFISIFKNM
jgi:hypothetical protein